MSLLILSRLAKPVSVRRSSFFLRLLSNGFSSSSSLETSHPFFGVRWCPRDESLGKQTFMDTITGVVGSSPSSLQTPPYAILDVSRCEEDGFGDIEFGPANRIGSFLIRKKISPELLLDETVTTIGASHGWIATLKDGLVCFHDDLKPPQDSDPKRIPLPSLVTLPHCQTQIVTNVSMSSSSPEDEDCVVAVKFLGPQLSFCKPSQPNSEWTNVRIENPCFHTSRVMFSKKDGMFSIVGSGGHLIGSWDLQEHLKKPKLQRLRFPNLPVLTKTKQELLHSCITSEHLVESRTTGETFLVILYKKATTQGKPGMTTRAFMVFKLDEEGNAVFTEDIGDLNIFISKSEPFCVPASSFPGMTSNRIVIFHDDEIAHACLDDGLGYSKIHGTIQTISFPYHIPPQKI